MIFNNILDLAKIICADVLKPGAVVIDATAGNGHDTLFLSDSVGEDGCVYAFDVQKKAIENTAERLEREGCFSNCILIHDGHQHLSEYIRPEHKGKIAVVMFNLGFLPSGDKTVVTRAETTVPAIESAIDVLVPKGVVAVAVYTGQDGGKEEEQAVRDLCASLDYHKIRVLESSVINKPGFPIRLFCLEKQ